MNAQNSSSRRAESFSEQHRADYSRRLPDRMMPRLARLEFPTFEMAGIRAQAITARDLIAIISESVANRTRYVVTNHNMHSLYLWRHDPKMRALHERADFTHVDGLPLIPLFRLFGARLKHEHRACYANLWPMLAGECAKRGWRLFYLGSKPGVAELGAELLREQYRGLQVRTHHGHFETQGPENETVLADIRNFSPDLLMVGMGMPLQEHWVEDNLDRIMARTIFCSCGGSMDTVAGVVAKCPVWIGEIGLQWLYRLIHEPGRLWHRYLVEPWFILSQLAGAYFKLGPGLESPRSALDDGNE